MLEFLTQFSCLLIRFNFLKLFAVPSWTAYSSPELDIPGAVVAMPNAAESSHQLESFLDTILELSPLDFYLLRCSQVLWCCNMTCYYHLQQLSPVNWAQLFRLLFFSVKYTPPAQPAGKCQIPSSLCTVFPQIFYSNSAGMTAYLWIRVADSQHSLCPGFLNKWLQLDIGGNILIETKISPVYLHLPFSAWRSASCSKLEEKEKLSHIWR